MLYYDGCLALPRKLLKALEVQSWVRPATMTRIENRRSWTDEEDQYVLTHTIEQAVAALGRSPRSISMRRWRLRGRYRLNHFIEVQADEEGYVWLMLHSGSRALGRHVCDHFNRIAQEMNARYHSEVPREAQLAYLSTHTEEGQAYLAWMRLCMAYALENRRRMLDAAVDALFTTVRGVAPGVPVHDHRGGGHAPQLRRRGAPLWRGRVRPPQGRGAGAAGGDGDYPGSMETGSYIARGLGNRESFETCSHGAGRRLSRTAAKKERTART